jgi:hypothetical protein
MQSRPYAVCWKQEVLPLADVYTHLAPFHTDAVLSFKVNKAASRPSEAQTDQQDFAEPQTLHDEESQTL